MKSWQLSSNVFLTLVFATWTNAQEAGNGPTRNPSISDDGRFVAFETGTSNLVIGSDTDQVNVGFFDRQTRKVYNAQFTGPGVYWGGALFPQISNDGEWMTFQSSNDFAPEMVGTNVYVCAVRSRTVGLAPSPGFKRISRNAAGEAGNGASTYPTISADGRFVAYMSAANNLTADIVPGNVTQIYRHDRDADEDGIFDEDGAAETATILVSQVGGTPGNAHSRFPTISADGSRILFITTATNLPSDLFSFARIWSNGSLFETTAARRGLSPEGDLSITLKRVYPALDPDGLSSFYRYEEWSPTRSVGFPDFGGGNIPSSGAARIVSSTDHPIPPITDDEIRHVYVFDRVAEETILISTGPNGPGSASSGQRDDNDAALDISRDGRFVAFVSEASNLGFEDTNGKVDIYIRDLETGELDRVDDDVTGPDWAGAGLSVSAVTATTALFTWNPSATDLGGVEFYRIDFTPELTRYVGGGASSSFVAEGLAPQTIYTAEIFAVDPRGNDTSGGSVSFTTTAEVPGAQPFAITGLSFSPNTIDVSFRSLTGKTYTIEMSSDLVNWTTQSSNISSGGSSTNHSVDTPNVVPPSIFLRVLEEE